MLLFPFPHLASTAGAPHLPASLLPCNNDRTIKQNTGVTMARYDTTPSSSVPFLLARERQPGGRGRGRGHGRRLRKRRRRGRRVGRCREGLHVGHGPGIVLYYSDGWGIDRLYCTAVSFLPLACCWGVGVVVDLVFVFVSGIGGSFFHMCHRTLGSFRANMYGIYVLIKEEN